MPLLPGEILNKRYRIAHLLAEGPYGAVYRAWDVADKRDRAIKEYLDPSVETQKLFRAEARRLLALDHPQLPKVRDHFALEEVGQYLVSDYVDGVDLQSLLDQYGPLPSDLIIGWLQAICGPLAYLHGKKQLHLNVKPANIRLTPAGQLFLVDTGLPGLGISIGASGYAAPEQQTLAAVSPASDIYSLGATLYTLLTGKTPPDALRRQSGLAALLPAREVNPDVEPYLSVVASRAMDMRPDVRFESVEDFSRALERPSGRPAVTPTVARRTEPAHAPPPPPPRQPRASRRQIQQRTIWGLLGALLLFAGIGIGVTLANRQALPEGGEAAATATTQSQIVAALTAITTLTATPEPSATPTPSPEPIVDDLTGARMIFMPPGSFRMGDDEGETNEQPSHVVQLDAYYIDQTEVTNGQYAVCVAEEGCAPPDQPGATYHPSYYGDPVYDDYPVIFVSWYDASAFCEWRGARLPSEAEWERGAGFDPGELLKLHYPWGDAFDGTLLNFCDVNCTHARRAIDFDDGYRDTAPVCNYPAGRSPIGLCDMSGNVMEWVSDWYHPRYYQSSPAENPLGPVDGQWKVLRGGSWLSAAEEASVTVRGSYEPAVSRANLGFRCAIPAP
jgi:formylglycine-generating enzyme required for sulfatase activity